MTRTLILLLALASIPTSAIAQAVPSVQLPEPQLLRQGVPAPFTGELMHQEDLERWSRRIEDLEHQLALDVRTEQERCTTRLDAEQARTTAAQDTLTLYDGLWHGRVQELASALADARRAAERSLWESPVLWFTLGAVVAIAAVVLIGVAIHELDDG